MMKRFWLTFGIVMLLIALLSLPVCSQPTQTPTPKPTPKAIELSFAYSPPPKVPPANGWEWFGKELGKRTNGQIKLTFYPANSLYPLSEAVDSVIGGVSDFGMVSVKHDASRFPLSSVVVLPGVIFPDTLEGILAASDAFAKLYTEFPEIRAEWKDLKMLWPSSLANSIMSSKTKVRIPKDVKGMKIGAGGGMADLMTALGGTAVNIASSESYMGLKTGIIDAYLGTWSHAFAFKLWETSKYHLDYGFGRTPLVVVMNNKSWNSLPPDIQDLIMELAPKALQISCEGIQKRIDMGRKAVADYGNTAITLTSEEKALWSAASEPLWEDWVSDMKADGHANAQEIFDRFKQLATEFSK